MSDPLAGIQRRAEKRTLPPGVAFPRTFPRGWPPLSPSPVPICRSSRRNVRGQGWYARNVFASAAGSRRPE